MPVPFSKEEQLHISENLKRVAYQLVREKSIQKISVSELTESVGISTGAFYKFYIPKEALFYLLLRESHEMVFGEAMEVLMADDSVPAYKKLSGAIVAACEALDNSGMKRFWLEDASLIMKKMNCVDMKEQHEAENKILDIFFEKNGTLKVTIDEARHAVNALIFNAYLRPSMGEQFRTILEWMADGVCQHIFE